MPFCLWVESKLAPGYLIAHPGPRPAPFCEKPLGTSLEQNLGAFLGIGTPPPGKFVPIPKAVLSRQAELARIATPKMVVVFRPDITDIPESQFRINRDAYAPRFRMEAPHPWNPLRMGFQ